MNGLPHLNGDNAPRGLRNAFKILSAATRSVRKKVRAGFQRAPRQVCKVCGATFDHAIVAPDALPQATLCAGCKTKLASGLTALVTMNPDAYAFVKSEALKAQGLAGRIVSISPENFKKIREKYEQQQGNAGATPQA